jgi:amino acid permease
MFVTIGSGLISAGPAGLLMGFIVFACCLAAVNSCKAEMPTYMPVSRGWIRMASHWVDDALGCALGWDFFLDEALLIPYEISARNLVLTFGVIIFRRLLSAWDALCSMGEFVEEFIRMPILTRMQTHQRICRQSIW